MEIPLQYMHKCYANGAINLPPAYVLCLEKCLGYVAFFFRHYKIVGRGVSYESENNLVSKRSHRITVNKLT